MFKCFVRVLCIFIILSPLLMAGCGDNQSSSQGSATFRLAVETPVSSSGKVAGDVPLDICADYNVQEITASFIDINGRERVKQRFTCSAHQGTVTGIPAPAYYTVRLEGLRIAGDDTTVEMRGERNNIPIYPNVVNDAGSVSVVSIVSDVTSPTVVVSTPATGAVSVPTDAVMNIVFSEAMAPSTINTTTVKLTRDGVAVAGAVNYSAGSKTATFSPVGSLASNTTYVLTVGTGVKDMADNGLLEPFICSFTTVVPVIPVGYSISGAITTSDGAAVVGVTVTLTGDGSTTAITNSNGSYSFSSALNGSYTLTPSNLTGYDLSPATLPLTVNGGNRTAMNFTATANTVPTAPSGLIATAVSASQINLAWTDNANNENSYRIERAVVAGGTYTPINTAAANSKTYSDTSLASSTTYYYRVVASNAVGDSVYSAVVNAKTGIEITPPVGAVFSDPTTGMALVKVTGGTYTMGDVFGGGAEAEVPTHQVTVGNFYIGKYEVTQGEWLAVMGGTNPSGSTVCTTCPVENVTWSNIQAFITQLNLKSGKNYRLPTEAEWEYAARSGGLNQKYSGGSDVNAVAWYSGNASGATHSVGSKTGNGLGLYDMSGNVWELVSDLYGDYSSAAQTNPTGPTASMYGHVIRGGSWYGYIVDGERTSARGYFPLTSKYAFVGFRLAASP